MLTPNNSPLNPCSFISSPPYVSYWAFQLLSYSSTFLNLCQIRSQNAKVYCQPSPMMLECPSGCAEMCRLT